MAQHGPGRVMACMKYGRPQWSGDLEKYFFQKKVITGEKR